MDIENKAYEENKGSSLSQKFSYGEITPNGISRHFQNPAEDLRQRFLPE